MAEPCIHEFDPAQCGTCNGAEARAAVDLPARGPWITAQFGGFCSGCQLTISPGDPDPLRRRPRVAVRGLRVGGP